MEQTTSKTRSLAKQLLAYESSTGQGQPKLVYSAQQTYEKLHAVLSSFVGSSGFDAILKRALAQAAMDYLCLMMVTVNQEGSLEGLNDAAALQGDEETADGLI